MNPHSRRAKIEDAVLTALIWVCFAVVVVVCGMLVGVIR